MSSDSVSTPTNFIRNIIIKDLETGKHDEIITRFPPEPNGHLHIGHAKSICLNFGVAAEFGGRTNLRFDDTNPLKENEDFMLAIMEDVRWLGFEWDELFHASDYFPATVRVCPTPDQNRQGVRRRTKRGGNT